MNRVDTGLTLDDNRKHRTTNERCMPSGIRYLTGATLRFLTRVHATRTPKVQEW